MGSQPLLLHVFPTFQVGGAQKRFVALANHFGPDFRHAVIALDGRIDCRQELAPGLDVAFPSLAVRKGNLPNNLRVFRGAFRNLNPSCLVTYNWGAIEAAMANWPTRVRHIHIEDGFGPEEAGGQFYRRILTRRLVLSRSMTVLPSRLLHDIALRVWKLSPSRVRYVPNGIDLVRFAEPAAPAFSWPGTGPVIGTVATLRREKNLPRLIEAFTIVRRQMPCRLVIAGDGRERAALERLAFETGFAGDIHFTGALTETERLYAGIDIFALSSDTEQMPLSVMEAMAAGRAIVSTDVGDVRSMTAPETAPFIVDKSAPAMAAALKPLLQDTSLRARVGRANQQTARESFDQAKMFATYRGLFAPVRF
jgi:glycosyltransferase involved in cell wall biosynthesis